MARGGGRGRREGGGVSVRRGEEGGRRWGGEGGVGKEEGGPRKERRKGREGGKGMGRRCWLELDECVRSHQVVQE